MIDYLKERSLTIINFIEDKTHEGSLKAFRDVILKAYKTTNLKALESIASDMNAWAMSLSTNDRIELDKILKEKGQKTLKIETLFSPKVKQIMLKGKISTEDEFRIIHDFINDYFNRISKLKKDKLNTLLTSYIRSNIK